MLLGGLCEEVRCRLNIVELLKDLLQELEKRIQNSTHELQRSFHAIPDLFMRELLEQPARLGEQSACKAVGHISFLRTIARSSRPSKRKDIHHPDSENKQTHGYNKRGTFATVQDGESSKPIAERRSVLTQN